MKSLLNHIIILGSFLLLVSCVGKNTDEPIIPSEKERKNINISLLNEAITDNGTFPRMEIDANDWSIIEYRTLGEQNDGMTHLHFLNPNGNTSIVVSGDDKGLIIYGYDCQQQRPLSEVIIATETNNQLIVMACDLDWSSMSSKVLSETMCDLSKSSRSVRGDFEDDIRSIFVRHLDILSGRLDMINDILTFVPYGDKVSDILGVWTDTAIPFAQYLITDDVSHVLPYSDEIIETEDAITSVSLSLENLKAMIELNIQKIRKIWNNGSDDEILRTIGDISRKSNRSHQVIEEFVGYVPAYKIDLSVTDITETSATLHGSYSSYTGSYPFISSMGYIIRGSDNYYNEITSDFQSTTRLDNLTAGTLYTVTAFVTSFGRRYEKSISFYTDVKLSFHPKSISFTAKGGSRGVALSIPAEMLRSWDIVSKPNWCKITKGAASFFVDVEASNVKREGDIVVKTINKSGRTESASLRVTQANAAWDGTSWNCSGTVKVSGSENVSGPISFGLNVPNVSSNDFSLSGDMNGLENHTNIYLVGDNLVLEMDYNYKDQYGSVSEKLKIVFIRTDDMSCEFIVSGSFHVSTEDGSESGNFTGKGNGTLVSK